MLAARAPVLRRAALRTPFVASVRGVHDAGYKVRQFLLASAVHSRLAGLFSVRIAHSLQARQQAALCPQSRDFPSRGLHPPRMGCRIPNVSGRPPIRVHVEPNANMRFRSPAASTDHSV